VVVKEGELETTEEDATMTYLKVVPSRKSHGNILGNLEKVSV
jgi:hypothetical protein